MYLYICNYKKIKIKDKYKKEITIEENNKINTYLKIEDRQRAFIEILLMKYLINKVFNVKIEDIVIDYNKFGKPYLKNNLNYKFNISHSNELIVIGMDFENEIGIDVEFKKNINLDSYIKILKSNEIMKLNTREDKLDGFYEIWTIKESFFKEEGRGLSIIDDDYYIDYDNCNIKYKNKIVSFKSIDYFQYKICICSKNIDNINIIDINNTMFKKLLKKKGGD